MKRVFTLLMVFIFTLSAFADWEYEEKIYALTYKTFMEEYIARLERDFNAANFNKTNSVISRLKDLSRLRYQYDTNSHYDTRDILSASISVFETNDYIESFENSVPISAYFSFMVDGKSFFDFMAERAIKALNAGWSANDILWSMRLYRDMGLLKDQNKNESESIYVGIYTFTVTRASGRYYFRFDLGFK